MFFVAFYAEQRQTLICYSDPMRELFTDTWRIIKLTAGIVAGPLVVWGLLVLLGVLR